MVENNNAEFVEQFRLKSKYECREKCGYYEIPLEQIPSWLIIPSAPARKRYLNIYVHIPEKIGENCAFTYERAFGLALLKKSESGLPVNLFLDDCGDWKKHGHVKQVYFQGNYADRADITDLVPLSISWDPEILSDDDDRYAALADCDIRSIIYFVEWFQFELQDLCAEDNSYSIQDFCKTAGKRNYDEIKETAQAFGRVRPAWKFGWNDVEPGYVFPFWHLHERRKIKRRQKMRFDKMHHEKEAKLWDNSKKLRPSKRFNKKYLLYLLTRGAKNSNIPSLTAILKKSLP